VAFHEKWVARRNRLLASRRFQYWASRFPLTRWIARRNVRALFDLVAGFVYSQVLSACVELRLFALLDQPQTTADLAPRLGLSEPAARRLLQAAQSLRLVEAVGPDRFALGQLGAALGGNPSVLAMIEHHALLYDDLRDPVALLRGQVAAPKMASFWGYAKSAEPAAAGAEQVGGYSALMAGSQALVADEILDAYDFRRHRTLLDIGGGEGVFLCRVAARAPQLGLTLFDLPAVGARAQERFARAGLAARVVGGSFVTDDLPDGADIASLVRVLHDHEDSLVMTILQRAYTALAPGGRLLIAEPMAGTRGAEPIGDAYFGFYLAAMGSGRARQPEELADFLRQTGFRRVRLLPTATPLLVRVMIAEKKV
jgi:demethylspheroidene O-methyltransferase